MEEEASALEKFVVNLVGIPWLGEAITAVIILAITAALAHVLTKFLRRLLEHTEGLPSSTIFVNIGRVIVWCIGASITLSTCFGVDVSALITALGIGGIAVSLGFQDTISNLIGGLQVSLLRIVRPGDHIEVAGARGTVKDVTWRHTTITNTSGEEILIPNSVINKNSLNHLPPAGKIVMTLYVTGDGTDLDKRAAEIETAALAAAKKVGAVATAPRMYFSASDDAGFTGSLILTMEDGNLALRAKDAVLRAVAPFTR